MQGAQMDRSPIAFSVGMREGLSPSSLVQVRGRSRGSVREQAPGEGPFWAREALVVEGLPLRKGLTKAGSRAGKGCP